MLSSLLAICIASGKLFLVGGGGTPQELVDRFIRECGGPGGRILVLPLASTEPRSPSPSAEMLARHGAKNLFTFSKVQPTEGDLRLLASKLADVKGIWMPGGNQSLIVQRLGKPWLDANFKPLLRRGVHFFGTSAGAMVCSDPMITGNEEGGGAKTGPGIGLTSWLVDSHVKQRKREARMLDAMKKTGHTKAVGLHEKEWIVIQDDRIVEIHGEPHFPRVGETAWDSTDSSHHPSGARRW
jgi:cyanophycinase